MAIGDTVQGGKPGSILVVGTGGTLRQSTIFNPTDIVTMFMGPRINPLSSSLGGLGIEIGMRFIPLVAGQVVGWAVYKALGDAETARTGTLWTIEGVSLASKASSGDPATGWITKNFDTPVTVGANTTYVISVFSPSGSYAYIPYFFNVAHYNWPLSALSSADAGGNGVYDDSGSSAFPSQTFNSACYMVDVLFKVLAP